MNIVDRLDQVIQADITTSYGTRTSLAYRIGYFKQVLQTAADTYPEVYEHIENEIAKIANVS